MMNTRHGRSGRISAAALALLCLAAPALAQSPRGNVQQVGFFGRMFGHAGCNSCQTCPSVSHVPTQPAQPVQPEQPPEAAPEADLSLLDTASAFDQGFASNFSAPNMIGDTMPFRGITNSSTSSPALGKIARARAARRYKIADNTSPIPRSRIYYSYNYFRNVFESPGDLHRNIGGFEWAFLDNMMSVELRQGLNSFARMEDGVSNGTEASNLVLVLKGVAYRGESFLISAGTGFGFPVGPQIDGVPGGMGVIAPFLGYLWQSPDGLFVQGFQQWDIPTESDDQSLMHSDIGVGAWLGRGGNGMITGIAPTVELHLYTPLGDAPSGSLTGLVYNDVLNITTGVTFLINDRITVSTAIGAPLTDRKDYSLEAQLHVNFFWGAGGIGSPYVPAFN